MFSSLLDSNLLLARVSDLKCGDLEAKGVPGISAAAICEETTFVSFIGGDEFGVFVTHC